jgi:L-alanine-DL-glutamate epimerase-like enolase superfamily enzyme
MEIIGVEAIVVETPAKDRRAADQTHEAALVRITSADGLVGIGEAAASPAVVKAFIDEPTSFSWSCGIGDILIGEDPRDPPALWSKLYESTVWSGRVGLGHIALAGVDMALWDLAGKAPAYRYGSSWERAGRIQSSHTSRCTVALGHSRRRFEA